MMTGAQKYGWEQSMDIAGWDIAGRVIFSVPRCMLKATLDFISCSCANRSASAFGSVFRFWKKNLISATVE